MTSARLILDLEGDSNRRPSAPAPAPHSSIRTLAVSDRERYRTEALEDLLDALPIEVFRAKGVAAVEDRRWMRFNVVGGRVQVEPDTAPPEHGETRMAFFGIGFDENALRAQLTRARATGPTRGQG